MKTKVRSKMKSKVNRAVSKKHNKRKTESKDNSESNSSNMKKLRQRKNIFIKINKGPSKRPTHQTSDLPLSKTSKQNKKFKPKKKAKRQLSKINSELSSSSDNEQKSFDETSPSFLFNQWPFKRCKLVFSLKNDEKDNILDESGKSSENITPKKKSGWSKNEGENFVYHEYTTLSKNKIMEENVADFNSSNESLSSNDSLSPSAAKEKEAYSDDDDDDIFTPLKEVVMSRFLTKKVRIPIEDTLNGGSSLSPIKGFKNRTCDKNFFIKNLLTRQKPKGLRRLAIENCLKIAKDKNKHLLQCSKSEQKGNEMSKIEEVKPKRTEEPATEFIITDDELNNLFPAINFKHDLNLETENGNSDPEASNQEKKYLRNKSHHPRNELANLKEAVLILKRCDDLIEGNTSTTRKSSVTIEKSFKCSICPKRLSNKGNLRAHMRIHSKKKLHKCSICSYESHWKSNLVIHTRFHTGELPYKCSKCPARFRSSSDLHAHSFMCDDIKQNPFKCSLCNKRFESSHTLAKHSASKRAHKIKEKRFKCLNCSKAFATRKALHEHENTHTGKKPFECLVCPKRYGTNSNLHRHARTHQRNQTQK